MNPDLKRIKKIYGEKMMHLCRGLFSTILEEPGALVKIMTDRFDPNPSLYDDILRSGKENFQDYIISLYKDSLEAKELASSQKGVEKLFSDAGYDFYECKTEGDIQSFRHYYARGEELCTFNGGRLSECYVFFAVKKNVKNIKRENFPHPEREDAYGTSVISIQFARNKTNTLSIKNRYNHTIKDKNPDATFSNNLENIIPGLTIAFAREYNFNVNGSSRYELYGYVSDANGKYYKYNYELDNVYYCAGNVVVENFEAQKYEKEKFILMDYFLLDLVNKKVTINPKSNSVANDSFVDELKDIERIDIKNQANGIKEVHITTSTNHEIIIGLNNLNQIVSYHNPRLVKAGDRFLYKNKTLKHLSLPNLEETGVEFLHQSNELEELNLPRLRKTGNDFMVFAKNLKTISVPNLEETRYGFLCYNECLEEINFPKLRVAGDCFINFNRNIKKISIPNLEETKDNFFDRLEEVEEINFPKLKKAGSGFMSDIKITKKVYFPLLEEVGDNFLEDYESLEEINQPLLKKVGSSFLSRNNKIKRISLPLLEEIGDFFLNSNTVIDKVDLPKLKSVGYGFLMKNRALTSLHLPSLKKAEYKFLGYNTSLTTISLPLLQEVGNDFLRCNTSLTTISLPLLKKVGTKFLEKNQNLYKLNLPNLEFVGNGFLENNQRLLIASLPKLKEASENFMATNKTLKVLIAPELQTIRRGFLAENTDLQFLDISKVKTIVKSFLPNNTSNVQIIAHRLAKKKREELASRFEIISQTNKKSKEESEKIDTIYGQKIVQILNSDRKLSDMVNDQIKNGIIIPIPQLNTHSLRGVAA